MTRNPLTIGSFVWIVLSILLMLGCSGGPSPETLKKFTEIQAEFDQANSVPKAERPAAFERIANRFQQLIDDSSRTGPMYYNLGNAWAKAEKPGKAIAAYQRAFRYMPTDPYLVANHQAVLGSATPLQPSKPLIEYLFFWQDWLSMGSKIWLSLILFGLTLVLGIAVLCVRIRFLRRTTLLMLALSLIAIASTGYDWYRFDWLKHAVVAVSEAMPRKGNSEQYDPAFTTALPLGSIGVVTDRRGDWLRIQFGSNQDGWLKSDQVVEY